jgi:divalent metal cation (Fe/Co/Zn/Cd) transporter
VQLNIEWNLKKYDNIATANRHRAKEQFPLIALTCVVVNNQTQIYKNASKQKPFF